MRTFRWMFLAALAVLVARLAAAGPVIREGDAWRFYKGRSTPPLQSGTGWFQAAYDDSTWGGPSPGGFGYGDSDDNTVFTDMNANVNGYVSVLTRRAFVIADTSTVTHLTLAADYDDGFIAYLNGVEIARRNLPGGAITHTTLATANHEASRAGLFEYAFMNGVNEKEWFAVNPGLLVNGTNVLAVSGHNVSSNSSDFSLIVELYTNVTLVRGPILQMPLADRVSVTWRTDVAADSVVEYGPDATYAAGTVSNAGPTRAHVVHLPVLPPGTTYHYRIRSAGVVLATNILRTPPSTTQAFRFAVIGDFGSSNQSTRSVANQIDAANVDLVLSVGDNIYQAGQPGSFDEHWFAPYSNVHARAPVLTVLGNHDIRADTGEWTMAYFEMPTNGPPGLGERNFSFRYGNIHFVCIDSNPFDVGDTASKNAIKAWLTNNLAQATQAWTFAVFHHPPHTSIGSHDDEAAMKAEIAPILEHYGVTMAFQGHNHWYERINPVNGVNYITTGGGGFSLHSINTRKPYSANLFRSKYSAVVVDMNGATLSLRALDEDGIEVDRFELERDRGFWMDGRRDSAAWGRATNGLALNAAIRGNRLYVATQDAGEGSDHFLYVADGLSTMRPANWAKSGQIMQWDAFLADENDGAFKGWFNAAGNGIADSAAYRAQTSGLNDNGTNQNGVLEGMVDLVALLGAFPTQLWFAAAPYGSADGGALVSGAQVPAGNGNGDIEAAEFLGVATRSLALDLPVALASATNEVEAGMWVGLDGQASSAPSGLPLSFAWSAPGPDGVVFSNGAASLAAMRLATNPLAAVTATVVLAVQDTRFDATTSVSIVFRPMVDSDLDGLTDGEEATGIDNAFTGADPAGRTSHVFVADSDGDGSRDGDEAVAGTSPNDPASVLRVAFAPGAFDTALTIQWPGVTNRRYSLLRAASATGPYAPWETNIPAVNPLNSATVPVSAADFITIRVEP